MTKSMTSGAIYKRVWRAANPERARAGRRAWNVANTAKINAARRAKYAADPSVRAAQKAWRKANPDKVRAQKAPRRAFLAKQRQFKRYGVTSEEYNEMLERQSGACAICGNPPKEKRLAIDHRHSDGALRGLLCHRCNLMLGLANDNPETLRVAVLYLLGMRPERKGGQ